jgi:hypothetical protein
MILFICALSNHGHLNSTVHHRFTTPALFPEIHAYSESSATYSQDTMRPCNQLYRREKRMGAIPPNASFDLKGFRFKWTHSVRWDEFSHRPARPCTPLHPVGAVGCKSVPGRFQIRNNIRNSWRQIGLSSSWIHKSHFFSFHQLYLRYVLFKVHDLPLCSVYGCFCDKKSRKRSHCDVIRIKSAGYLVTWLLWYDEFITEALPCVFVGSPLRADVMKFIESEIARNEMRSLSALLNFPWYREWHDDDGRWIISLGTLTLVCEASSLDAKLIDPGKSAQLHVRKQQFLVRVKIPTSMVNNISQDRRISRCSVFDSVSARTWLWKQSHLCVH